MLEEQNTITPTTPFAEPAPTPIAETAPSVPEQSVVETPTPEASGLRPSIEDRASPTDQPASAHETPTLMEAFEADHKDELAAQPKPEPIPEQPEPIAYELKLPEGLTGDAEQIAFYQDALGKHRVAPEAGQELLDMHAGAMQRYAEHMAQEQHRVWNDTRASWRAEVMADNEIGGAGHQTAMQSIFRMRDLFVPEGDRAGFTDFLRVTGAGDHPAFLRLLHRVAHLYDEGQPAPMPKPAPQPKQNNRRSVIYDHPSSQRAR